MGPLEAAVLAAILFRIAEPFSCAAETAGGRIKCTTGTTADRTSTGGLIFSDGTTIEPTAAGDFKFSNGLTAQKTASGWVKFSNGMLFRTYDRRRYTLSTGLVCLVDGAARAVCAKP
ncbi:MAG: hypothetical protein FJX35_11525 [Alphaproteobacteria bacterium]|nr:hypothetical protein [Alphaproteobacteria bacterium]